jgi:hypothetical protein
LAEFFREFADNPFWDLATVAICLPVAHGGSCEPPNKEVRSYKEGIIKTLIAMNKTPYSILQVETMGKL